MKKLTIFTDPHLGTSRQSHTTRESAARLKTELYNQAMAIVETAKNPLICVGDLFDKALNNESTLVQGYNVASRCWQTISGNHDELNREGAVTSLQALKEMGVPICSAPDLSTPFFEAFESIYMVPHHASQELFEKAMFAAKEHALANRDGLASYLFLHCNYDFSLAIEDNTLNLRAEMAASLGEAFDYIFLGHEHKPSTHLGGKVVVLGNTHPTSFADISDKFIYHLDLDTAELKAELVWGKSNHYLELKYGEDISHHPLEGIEFIDVVGQEGVASAVEIAEYIRSIWKAAEYKPEGEEGWYSDLLAVRNKIELKDALQDVDADFEPVQLESLQERIQKDLEGSDLAPLFSELAREVTA